MRKWKNQQCFQSLLGNQSVRPNCVNNGPICILLVWGRHRRTLSFGYPLYVRHRGEVLRGKKELTLSKHLIHTRSQTPFYIHLTQSPSPQNIKPFFKLRKRSTVIKGSLFLNFYFWYFTYNVSKCYWFLYIDFIFCYLTECVGYRAQIFHLDKRRQRILLYTIVI